MFNKAGNQLEYNLHYRAMQVLEVIDSKESTEEKAKVLVDGYRHQHTQLTICRNVIKKLLDNAGLPSYEQAIDKLLYQEQERIKL